MASKVDVQVEVKSPADKFWGAIRDSTDLFPKVFPSQYKSIEIAEGDGKSPGTIRIVKYAEGVPLVTFSKEKVEVADDANKLVSYSVIDGEMVNLYKTFKPTLQVIPNGDGSLVNWSLEFEKVNAEVPEPDLILETAAETFKDLDEYLLKN
ncbi:MLP-like protein 423 [Ananas comosus]|uniref:MLP-like protein 423 n=2 Tax=Ananas comosus TaxID=4615 RepID=A0A6P5EPE8_ANACO|nr:MLP-like protein 423 [Ananas comosus]CAD1826618.1 unnamed protein product [Ananas comosus var. bracteatus]